MIGRFTSPARQALIRAGTLALESRRPTLDADLLVLALAELRPALPSFASSAADVRSRVPLGRDRELLASLGIDADEVRRRARSADLAQDWWLGRSWWLRVTLHGPLGSVPLAASMRKVVEVASWKPGAVTVERLLWGLLADPANGAARLLAETGTDLGALVGEAGIPVHRRAA